MSNYVQGSLWKQCLEVDFAFVNVRKTERFPANLNTPPTHTHTTTKHNIFSYPFLFYIHHRQKCMIKKKTIFTG